MYCRLSSLLPHNLLDFDPEGQTLELNEANHQQKGHVACCREMFAYWVKGKWKRGHLGGAY